MPAFEGLLPEPHNAKILQLLFTFCHWHALAKMRLHTDATLGLLDSETAELGKLLRDFESTTCSVYKTRELKKEMNARKRRDCVKKGSFTGKPHSQPTAERQFKTLNLRTYKFHSLGDYVSTIKRFGTTDSYTTSIVSCPPLLGLFQCLKPSG
jgi:hypothetical protein